MPSETRVFGRVETTLKKTQTETKSTSDIDSVLKESASYDAVELEIGSGNGHFISSVANNHPDRLFIGIEIKKNRCAKIISKLRRAGLSNVAILCEMAEDVLPAIPSGSIDAIHVYFPDPWPKTRHRKKRLLRRPAIELIASSLKPGGMLYFATDFFDYSVQVKLLLLLSDSFSLLEENPKDEVYLSIFASKFRKSNRPIYFIAALRK